MAEIDKKQAMVIRRLKTMGLFEALLVTPSVTRDSEDHLEKVKKLVAVHEFELAFSQLTAVLSKFPREMSGDAWAILKYIGERVRAGTEDWHGLKPP